ncbi:MAG: diaminopimelate epimerase [Bacteroidales bacterium]|jgi:diaminopimelate epimerase|nr:diaminopimelate epimerase [Bacteroidales bacterium]
MKHNSFVKSHGLGNDYIVLDAETLNFELSDERIQRICDVHFGIGSDGILLKVPSDIADFGLRIYNTDASLAENCGNGLRIFSKFLVDYGYTDSSTFTVDILGRLIHCEILEKQNGRVSIVRVEMGVASFVSSEIPIDFPHEECVQETLTIADKEFNVTCVSVGNPHCVVLQDILHVDELLQYAPLIQQQPMFINGVNVQFAKVLSDSEVEIRIYERGVGYTLASGSSSCAVACAMIKNNLVQRDVTITMPGGQLQISVDADWNIVMTGSVREIASGVLSDEMINNLSSI